jgi:hypothetical protein
LSGIFLGKSIVNKIFLRLLGKAEEAREEIRVLLQMEESGDLPAGLGDRIREGL